MSSQAHRQFLEKWLTLCSSTTTTATANSASKTTARAIVQAWTTLRDSLQSPSAEEPQLLHQSLQTLVNSQSSLHVAEPQAKLLLNLLQSATSRRSFPLLLTLLYVWVRKSPNPNPTIVDSTLRILSSYVSDAAIFPESLLLLGAFSSSHTVSEKTKTLCLDMMVKLLAGVDKGKLFSEMPRVLAGIGYALSSSVTVYCVEMLGFLFKIWGKGEGCVAHGLMVLYMFDWVVENLVGFGYSDKMGVLVREGFGRFKEEHASFAVFMAAVGVLRALERRGVGAELVSGMGVKDCVVGGTEGLVSDLVSRRLRFGYSGDNEGDDEEDRLLLRCVSLGLTRTVAFSVHSSLFVCLALALLTEIFPLPRLYQSVIEKSRESGGAELKEIREHLNGVLFKEAGAVTGVLCSQYSLADEESKNVVENLMWEYCRDVYSGHRRLAVMLKGEKDELLEGLEKIAESAFLMVVVFAMAVTKHKLNSSFAQEIQMDVSLKILVSFSCMEYFRHVRLPEYLETIRKVVAGVKNEHACTSFVNSMPSYADLTNSPDQKTNYIWSKNEVQTARVLFCLRVIPTFVECLPSLVFRNVVAPIMFLYMEHSNDKVARASHSVFMTFMTMGRDSEKNDEASLKEQLVFHYMQRSLLGYPGVTPFEGMASGVVGMVQHLPAGSPAIFYCIHSVAEKANKLCSEVFTCETDAWKKWQGEPEPSKKLMDLLLRLVFLVDIQVLSDLMKLLAQLITKLPRDAQNIVLNELYSQVADSDDVVRKPTLVSWLQSLSFLCTKATDQNAANRKSETGGSLTFASIADPSNSGRITARL
ncbi:uncharacterized protein LOC124832765 [Vigna umbellata]|uniref:uncharacterized protein LOC124832765 n=1 Tax=Vigna umbellata TaxID=87088 RepID=UPI001F5FA3B7|nr:uncharacterized protein LOC124832765 [Vigna umbellata]XP_047163001.1 uncharacterized protein LOC124832765 [Vigna umbellata]XP_047163002.1 uncharacterized protein LOC124832765 [Vigna umbellata]